MAIEKVRDREQLKIRREPHWYRMRTGCYLGFRKTGQPAQGTWIARWRIAETDQHRYQSLGYFDQLPDNERFDAAKKAANAWFDHLSDGGTLEVLTVKDACARYLIELERENGAAAAADARSRFERHVFHEPIARVSLPKLTKTQVITWRDSMQMRPMANGKPKSRASFNRDMVPFRAALNFALEQGFTTTDTAWRTALAPIKGEDNKRTTYLDRDQRLALIAAAGPDLALFIKAQCLLPVRPGALAAATVADYNPRLSLFTVRQDKAGAGRTIKLSQAAAELFGQAARGKLPSAPLFSRWDGQAWNKDSWKTTFKAAAVAAGLPSAASMYSLRHAVLTDMVASGVDPATTAKLAGTSLLMIQKNYFHLQQDAAASALERIAL